MSLLTVGSGDASRDGNQSVLTGPQQQLCIRNCVFVAANGQFTWSVTLDVCLFWGKSFKSSLSSALIAFLFFLVTVLERNLRTLSGLDPVNFPAICHRASSSVSLNRHFQVQWSFKHNSGRDSPEAMQLRLSHEKTSWNHVTHKFNSRHLKSPYCFKL